jgi:hypothetical protein
MNKLAAESGSALNFAKRSKQYIADIAGLSSDVEVASYG